MPLERVYCSFRSRAGRLDAAADHDGSPDMLLEGLRCPWPWKRFPASCRPKPFPLVRVGYYTRHALRRHSTRRSRAHNLFEPVWQTIVPKIVYVCMLPLRGPRHGCLHCLEDRAAVREDIQGLRPAAARTLPAGIDSPAAISPDGADLVARAAWLLTIGLCVYLMLRYAGWIRWDLPGVAWLMRRRHAAIVLDGTSLAAEQQKPFADAVMQLAIAYPQAKLPGGFGRPMTLWRRAENDLESLYRVAVAWPDRSGAAEAAQRNGNFAWAARELADSNRRRLVYRTYALVQAVFPPIVCQFTASLSRLIAGALFMPLIRLISQLSPTLP